MRAATRRIPAALFPPGLLPTHPEASALSHLEVIAVTVAEVPTQFPQQLCTQALSPGITGWLGAWGLGAVGAVGPCQEGQGSTLRPQTRRVPVNPGRQVWGAGQGAGTRPGRTTCWAPAKGREWAPTRRGHGCVSKRYGGRMDGGTFWVVVCRLIVRDKGPRTGVGQASRLLGTQGRTQQGVPGAAALPPRQPGARTG